MVLDCTCFTKNVVKPRLYQDKCLICLSVVEKIPLDAATCRHPHPTNPIRQPPETFTGPEWRIRPVTAWEAAATTGTCTIKCPTGIEHGLYFFQSSYNIRLLTLTIFFYLMYFLHDWLNNFLISFITRYRISRMRFSFNSKTRVLQH